MSTEYFMVKSWFLCLIPGPRCGCGVNSGGYLDFVMQEFGSQVCAVRPNQRMELWVNSKFLEGFEISKRLKHRAGELGLEIYFTGRSVAKFQFHYIPRNVFSFDNVIVHGGYSRGAIFLKGSRWRARCQFSRSSSRCAVCHSATSASARVGSWPEMISPFSISMEASHSPYKAWKWGLPCSL